MSEQGDYWEKKDREMAEHGIRRVRDSRIGPVYCATFGDMDRTRKFASIFSCLGTNRYSVSDVLLALKRELIRLLRNEGCKPPHYKPSVESWEDEFAEGLYLRLQDVRKLIRITKDAIEPTVRLSRLAALPCELDYQSELLDYWNKLTPRSGGPWQNKQLARMRRNVHIKHAIELRKKSSSASRTRIAELIWKRLNNGSQPDHSWLSGERTIRLNIKELWIPGR